MTGMMSEHLWLPPPSRREGAAIHLPQCFALMEERERFLF